MLRNVKCQQGFTQSAMSTTARAYGIAVSGSCAQVKTPSSLFNTGGELWHKLAKECFPNWTSGVTPIQSYGADVLAYCAATVL